MEFVGFSFHFTDVRGALKALAAVEKLAPPRIESVGAVLQSIKTLADGFYLGWATTVTCGGARAWLTRLPGTFKRGAADVKMCGHHVAPLPGLDYEKMQLLTPEESGYRLKFYHIAPALVDTAVAEVALASAASSAAVRRQLRSLGVVAVATPGAKEIIQAPCACWSLSLLRRDPILVARSNLYTVGAKLAHGSNGIVHHATFNGNGGAAVAAKFFVPTMRIRG